jgi:hypothetical protein
MHWRALCFALSLGGCANLMGVDPTADYQVLIQAVVNSCDLSPDPNVSPGTAMEVGFGQVQAACEAFFVQATRAQQIALASNNSLDAGLAGATTIIGLTSSAAAAVKAIGITTAGVVFGKAVVNDYISVFAFGTYLYKIRDLTTKSMEDYITKARSSPPGNYCLAYTYVQKLATLCSLASLKSTLDEQVALPSHPNANGNGNGNGGGQGGAPGPMRRLGGFAPVNSGPPSLSYSVRPSSQ